MAAVDLDQPTLQTLPLEAYYQYRYENFNQFLASLIVVPPPEVYFQYRYNAGAFDAPQMQYVEGTGSIGSHAITEANDSQTATGAMAVFGTQATTDGADTNSSSGSSVTGDSPSSENYDSHTSVGSSVVGFQATIGADDAHAASGFAAILGTQATTDATDTHTASGAHGVVGTSAAGDANDTHAAFGLVVDYIGVIAVVESDDVSAGSGSVPVSLRKSSPLPSWRPYPRASRTNFNKIANQFFSPTFGDPYFSWGISLLLPFPFGNAGQAQFPDGRCLTVGGLLPLDAVSGGWTYYDAAATCFLFDRSGRSFTAVGSLPTPTLGGAVATTLGDGRILAITETASAQTMDSSSLTWTTQPSMSVVPGIYGLYGSSLTTLANGNALRIGGRVNYPIDSVEEFIQTSNTWVSRASLPVARDAHWATLLPNGEVFVSGREPGATGVPAVYVPSSDTWVAPVNSPSAGNIYGLTHVLLPSGQLLVYSGFPTPVADLYDPATRRFTPVTNLNWIFDFNAGSSAPARGFDIGDGQVVIPVPRSNCIFQLLPGQREFLMVALGWSSFDQLNQLNPHLGERYAYLATLRLNDGTTPTFAGAVSVVKGTAPDRVLVTWAAGSDPKTFVDDLNYDVFAAQTPGGQNFSSPDAFTQTTWPGSLSREVVDLSPDMTNFFVVKSRRTLGFGSVGDLDPNVVELSFTPGAIAPPVFSWVPTAPLDRPRMGLFGGRRSDGRVVVFGGAFAGLPTSVCGRVYSETGLTAVDSWFGPNEYVDGAVLNADYAFPPDYNTYGSNSNLHRVTALGGIWNGGVTSGGQKNWPLGWMGPADPESSGLNAMSVDMNEGVYRHSIVALPDGCILRTGGVTTVAVTNTVEHYRIGARVITYNARTGPFTVGLVVTSATTGARALILADDYVGPNGTLTVRKMTGADLWGVITDSASGGATALSTDVVATPFPDTWTGSEFVAPMNVARCYHSSVRLSDGRVLVVGGKDAAGNPVQSAEIYDPMTNAWTLISNVITLAYSGQVMGFTVAETITGARSGATAVVVSDANLGSSGTLTLSTISGVFLDAEIVTGSVSGNAFVAAKLDYSGKVSAFALGDTITGQTDTASATVLADTLVPLFPAAEDGGSLTITTVVGTFVPGERIVGNTLDYSGQTSAFSVGEIITGQVSGATATVVSDANAGTSGTLTVVWGLGSNFSLGEEVIGNVSGDAFVARALGEAFVPFALGFSGQVSPFNINEDIVGQTSLTSASVVRVFNSTSTSGVLTLTNVSGVFLSGEELLGSSGGNAFVVPDTLTYAGLKFPFPVGDVVRGQTSLSSAIVVSDVNTGRTGTLSVSGATGGFTFGERLLGNTLDYSGQTSAFSVGEIVFGQLSGATATIDSDANVGSSGTLTLSPLSGIVFITGEEIVGSLGGDAFVSRPLGEASVSRIPPQERGVSVLDYEDKTLSPFIVGEKLNVAAGYSATIVFAETNGNRGRLGVVLHDIARTLRLGDVVSGATSGGSAVVSRSYQRTSFRQTGPQTHYQFPLVSVPRLSTYNTPQQRLVCLKYVGLTSPFALGEWVVGQTSMSALMIVSDVNSGFTGTLVGFGFVGFAPSEPLLGNVAGVATTNGTSYPEEKVFCIGGGSDVVDVFDPLDDTFLPPAAPLDAAKTEHTAVVFGDGRIGVFGGRVGGISVADTRTYNPYYYNLGYTAQIGAFSVGLIVTGQVSGAYGVITANANSGSTGTLTLGVVSGTFIPAEQILDGLTGNATTTGTQSLPDTWTAEAGMSAARCRHVSFLLPNNKVLVVGGEDSAGAPLASAEISS